MKKIIFGILALVAVFLASCSNDDIEIIKSRNTITFEVNTQSIYDEFGVTNGIKSQLLRDKTYVVGVSSFIYDENGCLVDSTNTYSDNTNSVRPTFHSLEFGDYTAVFIQTIMYKDNLLSWDYRIEGIDNLSTLEIKQIDTPYWYAVLGVASQKFTVNEKNAEIQIVPKALGSIINCYFLNFTKSPCVNVGVGTHEGYGGYRLDPSIPEENRYIKELEESGYFSLLASTDVGEDEEEFDIYVLGNSLAYSMYYQTEDNMDSDRWWQFGSDRNVKLETGKQSYAAFAYLNDENGTVTSYFGDYNGMAQWYNEIEWGTGGKTGDLVPDLYMTWGGSVSNVQSQMKGYTMTVGNSGKAVLQNDGSYVICYNGKGKESQIMYSFTSATTGLFEIDVEYSKNEVSSDEILNYLNNNYIYLVDEAGTYMFCDKNYSTFVLFFEINGVWNIGFVDVNYLNNMSVKAKIPSSFDKSRMAMRNLKLSNNKSGDILSNTVTAKLHQNDKKIVKRK